MKLNTFKINKLQAERIKNEQRIEKLHARNTKLDEQIAELENTDIIGLVRSVGLTPEQLADFLQAANGTIPGLEPEDADEDTQEAAPWE